MPVPNFSELIRQAKSVNEILAACPDLRYSANEDSPGSAHIVCETCARYKSEKDVYNSGTGIFGLPEVENDVELNDLNRTNRWFSNLKVNIRRHVDIKTHVDAKDYFLSIEERKFKLRNKNLSAAINVVRTAYVSLKLGDSFASITSRLANLSLAGAQVGHKNHSYRIPPEVVDETALVIEEHMDTFNKTLSHVLTATCSNFDCQTM